MVLSLWMSSGRTMPATISSRISKLTRSSCLPSTTRLPLGSTCVTTAATLVCTASWRLIEPLPSLDAVEFRGEDAAGQDRGRGILDGLGADEVGDAGILAVRPAALGLVGGLGGVGDVHRHGQDVADLMGALVLEEFARARAPQRVLVVDRGGRLRHRHVHRLVAGLGGRVLDRGERRLLAEVPDAGRARSSRRGRRRAPQQRAGGERAGELVELGHVTHSAARAAVHRL